MAVFNEILVGRFSRYIQRVFGMKGGNATPSIASDIFATIGFQIGKEDLWLQGWQRFGIIIPTVAGGAGTNGQVRLRNPTNSNVIAIVEKASYIPAIAGNTGLLQIGQPGSDLAAPQNGNCKPLDGRSATNSSMLLSSGTPVGAGQIGSNIWQANAPGATVMDAIIDWNQELVLTPGWCIAMIENVANQPAGFVIWWRERYLEDSERT